MSKALLLFIVLAFLCFRADSQNRPNSRPQKSERRLPGPPGLNGRERPHPNRRPNREGKNGNQIEDEEDDLGDKAEMPKNVSEANSQPIHQQNDRRGIGRQKQKQERPLIELIFLLVVSLVLIVLILIFKLFRNNQPHTIPTRQTQLDPPSIRPSPSAPKYPEIKLDEEIVDHRNRLKKLERLKQIKEKYLASSHNSQMELAAEEKKIEEQLRTPTFAVPFTFRVDM